MRDAARILATLLLVSLLLVPTVAAAGERYEVHYRERPREQVFDGALREGEARTVDLLVSQANLTRIEVVLRWTEPQDKLGIRSPSTFWLSARKPDGDAFAGSPLRGSHGVLILAEHGINELPKSGAVAAPEELPSATDAGRGVYRVTVRLTDDGYPDGAGMDRKQPYVLSVVTYAYDASVMRVVTLPPPVAGGPTGATDEDTWMWATLGLAGASVVLAGVAAVSKRKS